MEIKDWEKRSLMSGTSVEKIKQAINTFGNEVGPGQYQTPFLIGQNVQLSHAKNYPSFSIGEPRLPNVVNPETKDIIGMKHTTPSPAKYQIPSDNSLFKRNVVSVLYKEKKFFTQKNMP